MRHSEIVERRTRRIAEAITAHPTAHPLAARRAGRAGGGRGVADGDAGLAALGRAGINDIAFPILLTPLLWALPFFYACLEENLVRGTLVISGATSSRARWSPSRWRDRCAPCRRPRSSG